MADDPRALDRERYERTVWTRQEREEFNEVVRLGLSPADDITEKPPERGPFMSVGEFLAANPDMAERWRKVEERSPPGLTLRGLSGRGRRER
jgi:hypothetical protein